MDNIEKIDLNKVDWKSSREFFESLTDELKKLDDRDETYDFTWVGKRKSIIEAGAPISKILRPDVEASKDFDNTENMLIVGDNLDALKILQESYLGQVKMIYIDPPYNTGHDFVYHDNFTVKKSEYEDGSVSEDGEVVVAEDEYTENSKANGRFHSDWLSMMYPRLKLARGLLADDGVIFISIDDNEQANLKKLCDEVFGEENFIAEIIRNTNSSKNQSLFVSVSHEYCLVYARSLEILQRKHEQHKWSVDKNNVKEYLHKVQDLKQQGMTKEEITSELKILTRYPRFIDFTNYWYFDDRGLYRKDNLGGVKNGNMVPIINPFTGRQELVPPGGYRYGPEKLQRLIDENRIHFHDDGSLPVIKRYLNDYKKQRPKSIMSDDQRPDYALLQEFHTPFDNPKQLDFIRRIVSIVDDDSLILDFFAGSGTTGHAVMDLNAEDGGNRKYILVQLPEKTNEKSEARNAGYETIDQITAERLRRAGEKVQKEHPEAEIDTGFRVFRVDSSNENEDIRKSVGEYTQEGLLDTVENIKADRRPLDLLFGVVYASALPFDLKLEVRKMGENTVYFYGYFGEDSGLAACFDDDISDETIKEIAKLKTLAAVFKDSSFVDSSAKVNLSEHFRILSVDTKVKVI